MKEHEHTNGKKPDGNNAQGSVPKAASKPASGSASKPEPKPTSNPASRSAPKQMPKAAQGSEPKPEPKLVPKLVPKAAQGSAPMHEPKQAPKQAPKPEPKQEHRSAPRQASRTMTASKAGSGPPTLPQWTELYDIAMDIRAMNLWHSFWDTDLVTIVMPSRPEPIYCSIMGRNGTCYAIGIYPGNESIIGFYRIANTYNIEPHFVTAYDQKCLMCYYGDREEVMPEDRAVLNKLNLRFRGRNEWIYFRAMDPGYIPWHINSEQASLLTETLHHLVMATKPFIAGEIDVDFENSETLMRSYSKERNTWINKASKMPPILSVSRKLKVENEVLASKLKKKRRNGMRLEFEVVYLPTPIQGKKEERPYFPRIILLADKTSGLPVDFQMADKNDEYEIIAIEMLTRFIEDNGKPESINVRDERTGNIIEDFCQKIGVEAIEGMGMPTVDNFLENMLDTL